MIRRWPLACGVLLSAGIGLGGGVARAQTAPAPSVAQTPAATVGGTPSTAEAAQPTEAATETELNPERRSIDFGLRLTSFDGDVARAQRFRDLRDGAVLERFRFAGSRGEWLFGARADHVGYRDQHYAVEARRPGRLDVRFDWDEVPFFLSETTRTLYTSAAPGTLAIDEGIRRAIQAGTLTLANASAEAERFDLRSERKTALVDLTYHATADLDARFRTTVTMRDGAQPWGAGFGFANDIEVAAPIDTRTTDVMAGLEWARDGTLLRVAYDGSWFDNAVPFLVWDNPLRATDSATAPAQGRLALAPSSAANTVSATGSSALPGRSRVTAYISRGQWNQDETLLPHTINSAIASPPLERQTADAEAAVTAVMLRGTSRPRNWAWFGATWRRYDFDNRTPPLHTPTGVNYDSALATRTVPETEPFSFTRGLLELDSSLTPWKHGAFRVGYSREAVDRTFRLFETTTEHAARLSYDLTSIPWITVRGSYVHAKRAGEGLDEEVLSDIGEQVSLRQFDISDRVRDQGTLLVLLTPSGPISVNASIGAGQDDRPDAQFGLTDASFQQYAFGADYVLRDGVTFGATYGYERYTSLQQSRQANPGPQFNDPTRDWATDATERVHIAGASAEWTDLVPRLRLLAGYDFTYSRARYLYVLPANSTLPPVTQLPAVRNEWHQARVEAGYTLRKQLSLGVRYMFERFRIDDFALNASTIDRLVFPSTLLLGYNYRPYTVNSVNVTLRYLW